jgi:hypothetical protein
VGSNENVVPTGQSWQEVREKRLGSTYLGERDDDKDAR